MSVRKDRARAAAEALAPFLAEHYYATGVDLTENARLDRVLLRIAGLYADLPALAEQAAELCAGGDRLGAEPVRRRGRGLHRQTNLMLSETADAIRHRLQVIAVRSNR